LTAEKLRDYIPALTDAGVFMRLIVNRSQAAMKGMFGGHKGVQFTLSYRLELTDEERALVEEYRLEYYPLTWRTVGTLREPDDMIANMVTGRSQTLSDVTTLISNERIVKDACDALPPLFEIVRSFGGDEVVEYPRQAIAV
jgi:hypothetical protein